MTDTERARVMAARSGDAAAFGTLVADYERPVFTLCYRMLSSTSEAEDAAQETFVRAYRALNRYDPARPFSTWLLSIAAHHCIDRLRRRRVTEIPLEAIGRWRWLAALRPGPEEAAIAADRTDRIAHLLARLPTEYRVVVVLRYWHDLGYREIAEVLGDTESAVKSRLHRARRLLAEWLAAESETASAPRAASERLGSGEIAWAATRHGV